MEIFISRKADAPRNGVSRPKTRFFGWRSRFVKFVYFTTHISVYIQDGKLALYRNCSNWGAVALEE
jgi:hypothetical protein